MSHPLLQHMNRVATDLKIRSIENRSPEQQLVYWLDKIRNDFVLRSTEVVMSATEIEKEIGKVCNVVAAQENLLLKMNGYLIHYSNSLNRILDNQGTLHNAVLTSPMLAVQDLDEASSNTSLTTPPRNSVSVALSQRTLNSMLQAGSRMTNGGTAPAISHSQMSIADKVFS